MSASHPPAPIDTDVVWWRVAQYIVDSLIVGIGVGIGFFLFLAVPTTDEGAADSGSALFWIVSLVVLLWSLFWVLYVWVLRPHRHDGQTFGMQAVGIRIVSADGGPASLGQLLGRAFLLVLDTLLSGLVGLLTMAFSKRHQRIGDMAAGTLVGRVEAPGPTA
jgi:uncharacterized RDD family membrane protein YckC